MRIELIRPVKNGGKWHAPGASLDVSDELAKELVGARVAFTVPDPVGPIGPNSPAPETDLGANEDAPGELDVDEELAKELVSAGVADASPEAPEDNEPDRENETPAKKKARLKAEAKARAKQEREANK